MLPRAGTLAPEHPYWAQFARALAGLMLAPELEHPPSAVHALWFGAETNFHRRDPRMVMQIVGEWLPMVSVHGSAVGMANAMMLRVLFAAHAVLHSRREEPEALSFIHLVLVAPLGDEEAGLADRSLECFGRDCTTEENNRSISRKAASVRFRSPVASRSK